MSEERITPVVMPKWGLSMQEGKLTGWLVDVGAPVGAGQAILEIETDKIAGSVEASGAGILRRRIGEPAVLYPVKALLGVIAHAAVPEAEIDAYVGAYVTPVAGEGEDEAAPAYEFLELDVGKIRYARRGAGARTVVLIHGFGGDLDNWLFNIDALGEVATVLALDLPGHGQSVKTITDPSVDGLARVVIAFMDRLGVESAHLVGHSLGGGIAMAVAAMAPPRVRSLSLIAPVGLGVEVGMDYINGFVQAASKRDLKPVLELLFASPELVGRKMVDDILKYKRLDGVDAALSALAEGVFGGGQQRTKISPGSTPTLLIWGREDRILPVAHTANVKGARVEILEGAGHMAQMEKAAQVNTLIKARITANQ